MKETDKEAGIDKEVDDEEISLYTSCFQEMDILKWNVGGLWINIGL